MVEALAGLSGTVIGFLGAWLLQERAHRRNSERDQLEMDKLREELTLLTQQVAKSNSHIVLPTDEERKIIEAVHSQLREGGQSLPSLFRWVQGESESTDRIQYATAFLRSVSALFFELRCYRSGRSVDEKELAERSQRPLRER